jgi:hypothetical protein
LIATENQLIWPKFTMDFDIAFGDTDAAVETVMSK